MIKNNPRYVCKTNKPTKKNPKKFLKHNTFIDKQTVLTKVHFPRCPYYNKYYY